MNARMDSIPIIVLHGIPRRSYTLLRTPASEKKLVDNKTGINYQLVMHNDFILVGPATDPAKVKATKTTTDALKAIYASPSLCLPRG
ncbi:ABC-type tungstate transport system, periplasmic binding protein [Desulfosporosinus metallidurans]|uniref:ABC-type tungstate transport system, periplasmic binding protein n=1 Tax=Desulfosporosinus metallidurans TaxID=1888891 RepID=A0A1Q8QZC7_9FIRM|nr:ABC-type tungstate transport system, periplasmic binding protein [Desulfosporosinus metallidurans]